MRNRLIVLTAAAIVILCMTWIVLHPYSYSNLVAFTLLCTTIIVAGDKMNSTAHRHKHGRQALHHRQQAQKHPVHKPNAGLSPLARSRQ